MLDTNTISEIARNPDGSAARKFSSMPSAELCTSIVVSAEVLFGLKKSEGHRLRSAMTAILDSLEIMHLEQPVDERYAEVRWELHRQGKLIGPNDLFIAAHALTLDATLVTANVSEFSRVPGLKVENWLQPQP